eukprot:398347_1
MTELMSDKTTISKSTPINNTNEEHQTDYQHNKSTNLHSIEYIIYKLKSSLPTKEINILRDCIHNKQFNYDDIIEDINHQNKSSIMQICGKNTFNAVQSLIKNNSQHGSEEIELKTNEPINSEEPEESKYEPEEELKYDNLETQPQISPTIILNIKQKKRKIRFIWGKTAKYDITHLNIKSEFIPLRANDYIQCDGNIKQCNVIKRVIHILEYYKKFTENSKLTSQENIVPVYEYIASR